MPLIETADERAKGLANIKMVVLGTSGVGKTTLAGTLDNVLVLDCESGMLALNETTVDSINISKKAHEIGLHPWQLLQYLVCLLVGPSPNVIEPGSAFSQEHFVNAVKMVGTAEEIFGKYDTIFVDSLTEISRFAFSYAKSLPSSKNAQGKLDTRGAYGTLGQEMVGADGLLNRLKHTKEKNVVIVAILDELKDDGVISFKPQVEGSKTGQELTGIFDIVATMADLPMPNGKGTYKALVCKGGNQWGFPAKDRSGQLDEVEPPDLGLLLDKVRSKRPRVITRALPEGFDDEPVAPVAPADW